MDRVTIIFANILPKIFNRIFNDSRRAEIMKPYPVLRENATKGSGLTGLTHPGERDNLKFLCPQSFNYLEKTPLDRIAFS